MQVQKTNKLVLLMGVKWGVIFLIRLVPLLVTIMFAEQSVLSSRYWCRCGSYRNCWCLVAMQTEKGRTSVAFAKESRTEVRKVVWPTRQEAIQTTGYRLSSYT